MSSHNNPHSPNCACGCGGLPVRGEFLSGHDAKLRSKFLRRIDDGEEAAINEFLTGWPKLAYPYGYTEENLQARLGRGLKTSRR